MGSLFRTQNPEIQINLISICLGECQNFFSKPLTSDFYLQSSDFHNYAIFDPYIFNLSNYGWNKAS